MPKKIVLEGKKIKFDHSLVFSCLHFSYLLVFFVFIFNFSKHDCNGGEEETYFALRIMYVCVHACKACCRHPNIDFTRRMGEVCTFELGLGEYGT